MQSCWSVIFPLLSFGNAKQKEPGIDDDKIPIISLPAHEWNLYTCFSLNVIGDVCQVHGDIAKNNIHYRLHIDSFLIEFVRVVQL